VGERFSCALESRARTEPCYGTASQVRRWVLVEQPGAWGADAVRQSDLPVDVAVALDRVARRAGARLLLIRRHGRSAPAERSCFVAVTTADVRRVERIAFTDARALLDLDLAPLRAFAPVGGDPVTQPLYLVCTNGSHDTCCARFGRPVAQALHDGVGALVWESSHYGGDRFAGNLVCLPDGIYYGRLDAVSGPAVVAAHAEGRLDLAHLRGRCFLPFVAQAADWFVRRERDLDGIDDVMPGRVVEVGDGTFRVTVVTATGQTLVAHVACDPAAPPQQLTCRSAAQERPPRFRLLGLA
jgi:hypothetical protein